MKADSYIELHDGQCPRCGDEPFTIERQYDQIRYTVDGNAKRAAGDPFCSECGRRLEPVDLPLEMNEGWSVITR